jgi:hypothetical protein
MLAVCCAVSTAPRSILFPTRKPRPDGSPPPANTLKPLCAEIHAAETQFPGTELRLTYELVSAQSRKSTLHTKHRTKAVSLAFFRTRGTMLEDRMVGGGFFSGPAERR